MAQITEDYVGFETAKLLKEKGFDEDIDLWYDENGDTFFKYHYAISRDWRVRQNQQVYQHPTLQMAMKWLLQTHNIFIEIRITNHSMSKMINVIRYYWILSCSETGKWVDESTLHTVGAFISPEEACEAAIKYCLEHLI